MTQQPSIAVIIPAYQSAETIERALRSVGSQTVHPDECIVVDDGSTDGTYDKARSSEHLLRGVPLKVLKQSNAGAGAARNTAIAATDCDFLAMLDADDEWMPEKLERSMAAIIANNLDLVAHDGIIGNGDSEARIASAARFKAAGEHAYHHLYTHGYIATSSVIVKRSKVMETGGFDTTLPVAQDFDLWLRVLGNDGVVFEVLPHPLFRYHVTAGSITSHTERRLACTLRVATKNKDLLAGFPGKPRWSYLLRIVIVHGEAVSAMLKNHSYGRAGAIVCQLPFQLIKGLFN